jgi:hypothetical protein
MSNPPAASSAYQKPLALRQYGFIDMRSSAQKGERQYRMRLRLSGAARRTT